VNHEIKEQQVKVEQLQKTLEKLKDGRMVSVSQSKEIQSAYLVEVRYVEKLLRLEKEKLEKLLLGDDSKKKTGLREQREITGKVEFVGQLPKNPRI